jgi:hypothetical protein
MLKFRKNFLFKNKSTTFLYIFVILFLLINIFGFLITSSPSSSLVNNCETPLKFAESYFDELNMKYKIVENNDLKIIPNIKNLKCIGKVIFIEDFQKIKEVNTSVNKSYEYIIYFAIFYLIFKTRKSKYLKLFSIIIYYLIFLTIYQYKFNLFSFFILTLFLISYMKFDTNSKLSLFIISFFIYFNFNNLEKSAFSSNETFYIGKLFKSKSEFSSYIAESTSFSLVFENLIQILINIFGTNFYLILNFFVGILFCFFIFKISLFYKINSIYVPLIFIFLNLNQSIMGNTVYYFGGIEPNTFGNLFFTISIYSLLRGKSFLSIIFYSAVAYIHLALAIVFLPLYLYLNRKYLEKFIFIDFKSFALSLTLSLPLLWVIYDRFKNFQSTNNIEINRYLIIERAPHHLYPFITPENKEFILNPDFGWAAGYRNLFIGFAIVLLLNYFFKNYADKNLFQIIRFLFFITIMYSFFVYFFPYSNFVILHPFKITSYFVVFVLLFCFKFLSNFFIDKDIEFKKFTIVIFVFLSIHTFTNTSFYLSNNFEIKESNLIFIPNYHDIVLDSDNLELINFLKTRNSDVLLIPEEINKNHDFLMLLEAYSGLPTYALSKFSPTNEEDFTVWRNRLLKKELFFEGICDSIKEVNQILYLSYNSNQNQNNCGELIFKNNNYSIFLSSRTNS